MNPSSHTALPADLSETQRAALISLLEDEDPAVYKAIRSKLLSYGQPVRDWLKPYSLSRIPVLRRRAQEIILHLARQTFDETFLAFCLNHGEDLPIEEGSWLLVQTQYPDINVEGYQALFDSYASDLRERLDFYGDAESILGSINQYLFDQLGYYGHEQYASDPECCFLNRVVDRRTGNPISLCLVYLMVTRRLRLPVTGIGLPGHFVCRYQSSTKELFIDVFNKGRLLTKADCIKYLVYTNHGLQDGYLTPITPRRMLMRMCANLHQIYLQLESAEDASRLQRYLVALSN